MHTTFLMLSPYFFSNVFTMICYRTIQVSILYCASFYFSCLSNVSIGWYLNRVQTKRKQLKCFTRVRRVFHLRTWEKHFKCFCTVQIKTPDTQIGDLRSPVCQSSTAVAHMPIGDWQTCNRWSSIDDTLNRSIPDRQTLCTNQKAFNLSKIHSEKNTLKGLCLIHERETCLHL